MVWVCGSDSRQMRELQVRDEDEREAGKIEDWGVSERCNYSSQQGEGEITTHSMLRPIPGTPPVCACKCGLEHACMYLDCVQAPHASTCALLAQEESLLTGSEHKKKKRSSAHQHNHSWLHAQWSTHVALHSAGRSLLCFMADAMSVMELCSLVNLGCEWKSHFQLWASPVQQNQRRGGGPGSNQSLLLLDWLPARCWPTVSHHASECHKELHAQSPEEKVLRKCLHASLGFLTGLIGSHMFIYVFAISLRPPLSSRKNVSRQILKETKT